MTIKDVYTIAEASKIWGIPKKTIRDRCALSSIFTEYDTRKSEGTWLITKNAMIKAYGEPKNKNEEV